MSDPNDNRLPEMKTVRLDAEGEVPSVRLASPGRQPTTDQGLWELIKWQSERRAFNRYKSFVDWVLCGAAAGEERAQVEARKVGPIEFRGVAAYGALKTLTELFLKAQDLRDANDAPSLDEYLVEIEANHAVLPYLKVIRERLRDHPLKNDLGGPVDNCYGPLLSRLKHPSFVELIWNYWHEEAMVTQTIKAIAVHFQNRQLPRGYAPLTTFQLDSLRPMGNLMWGWIQDEVNRLTVSRRAHEYHHQYGLSLAGRAVRGVRPAETRSRFLQAFHELLNKATVFYDQVDEMTRHADGFPVLNALRELHVILAEGAHNQFTDLTLTARGETLMEMWLLARPEMREFFGQRIMIPYPEPWMDRVDTMKSLQGWSETSVTQFHFLAAFGEQLLLSVRYGNWMNESDPVRAANWAVAWRPQVQNYIHAYHAVTGVNLAAREVRTAPVDTTLPSVHLARRIEARQRALTTPAHAPSYRATR